MLADKRIAGPFPLPETLNILRSCFETQVLTRSLPRDRHARHEIVDFSCVSDGPHKSHCVSFTLRFFAELRHPDASTRVFHAILFGIPAPFFFDRCETAKIGLHLLATRSKKQIARSYIARLTPHYRRTCG